MILGFIDGTFAAVDGRKDGVVQWSFDPRSGPLITTSIANVQVDMGEMFDKGSFKCYVTLEGVGGYMPKRYEGVGGVTSALRKYAKMASDVANTANGDFRNCGPLYLPTILANLQQPTPVRYLAKIHKKP